VPEWFFREPYRIGLFFVAVFGLVIACMAAILWQQARNQDLILLALQKSDRNNQTTWKSIEATRKTYEAGRKTRARLIGIVAEEKRMNEAILRMNRDNEQMNRQQLRMGRAIIQLLRKRR